MNLNSTQGTEGLAAHMPWKKKSSSQAGRLADDEKFTSRLPFVKKFSTPVRGHIVAILGEAVGTFLFLFFAFAAMLNANTTDDQIVSKNLYIALGFGFSLVVNAWTFFRVSGGLFNPAVTWGMCLVGAISWFRGALLFVTQLVAALVAAGMARALFPADLSVQTILAEGTSLAQGFFIEMFLTLQLVLTIFMLAKEKNRATFIAPVGIGLSLFLAELAGVRYTGGSLNPARSFAPCVVNANFNSYHWIYWIGPLLGASVAAVIYNLIKMLEYETATPDMDDTGEKRVVVDNADDLEESSNSDGNAHRTSRDQHQESQATDPSAQGARSDYQAGPDLENGRAIHAGSSSNRR